jgi:predicted DNA-binding transcriptional regulator AlpA
MVAASAGNLGLQLVLNLGIDAATTAKLQGIFRETLETTLKKTLAEIPTPVPRSPVPQSPEPSLSASQSQGTDLKSQDKLKAADLRTALLLGKLPNDSSLMIDTRTFAGLLSISYRHLIRLQDLKEVPEPVHLGRLIRWPLAEVLEWIEADCPSQKAWAIMTLDSARRRGR